MRRFIYLIPAMVWILFITTASLISGRKLKKIPLEIEYADKIVHFVIYFVLSFLLIWGWFKFKNVNVNKRLIFVSFMISICIGILMEILQSGLTSTRSFDIYDIIANIIGAFIGSAIFLLRIK